MYNNIIVREYAAPIPEYNKNNPNHIPIHNVAYMDFHH